MYVKDYLRAIPTKKAVNRASRASRPISDAEKARVGARLREAHDALWARVRPIYAKARTTR